MQIHFDPRGPAEAATLDLSLPGTVISAHKKGRRYRAVDAAIDAAGRQGALIRTRVAGHKDAFAALRLDAAVLAMRGRELESREPIDYRTGDLRGEVPFLIAILDLDWGADGQKRGKLHREVENLWDLARAANAHILISTPSPPTTIPVRFLRGGMIHLTDAADPEFRDYCTLHAQLTLRAAG